MQISVFHIKRVESLDMEGHKGPIISLITIDPKDLFLQT